MSGSMCLEENDLRLSKSFFIINERFCVWQSQRLLAKRKPKICSAIKVFIIRFYFRIASHVLFMKTRELENYDGA